MNDAVVWKELIFGIKSIPCALRKKEQTKPPPQWKELIQLNEWNSIAAQFNSLFFFAVDGLNSMNWIQWMRQEERIKWRQWVEWINLIFLIGGLTQTAEVNWRLSWKF